MEEPGATGVRGVRDIHDKRLWFALVARGVVALLFAIVAMGTPWMPVGRLARLFAAYALADSALTFFVAGRARRTHAVRDGRLLAIEALLSGGAAVVALAFPAVTPLRIIGGLRGLVIGSSDVLWSRRGNASDLFELAGVVAFAFGVVVLAWPGPGSVALPWLLGLSTLVSGALLFAGAMSELRNEQLLAEPRSS